jgi:dTDP-glucose 4,6-dehydratase
VEGFLRIALVPAAVGQVVNIGSGREISVGELADMILRIIGKSVRIIVESERIRPEKSEVERLICDSHKAKHLLGWEPKVTLEEGLERTVEWFKHNWQRYKADVYNV